VLPFAPGIGYGAAHPGQKLGAKSFPGSGRGADTG